MVEDLHRNIFHRYGEPLLENNVTKALINVLEKCNKEKVLKPFLEKIIPKITLPKKFEKLNDTKFKLLRTDEDAKYAKQKYAIGISPEVSYKPININKQALDRLASEYKNNKLSEKHEHSLRKIINTAEDTFSRAKLPPQLRKIFANKNVTIEELQYAYDSIFRKSLPDALIWSDKFAVLIENKIYGGLIESQMDKHRRQIDTKNKVIRKSWIKDIYPVIKEVEKNQEDGSKERFLLKEFREYLEVIGLAPFEGFRKEDFVVWTDDEARKLKDKFKKLAEELKKSMKKKGLKYFEGKSNLPQKDVGWYGFYDQKSAVECPYCAHFSIFHRPGKGLGVKLHLKLNNTNDGEKFRDKLKNEKKKEKFYKLLEGLRERGKEYEVTLSENETMRPRVPEWGCEYTVYSKYIDSRGGKGKVPRKKRTKKRLERIREMIAESAYKPTWFSIYFTIWPKDAEELGKDVIKEIENVITSDLWDLYTFIVNR